MLNGQRYEPEVQFVAQLKLPQEVRDIMSKPEAAGWGIVVIKPGQLDFNPGAHIPLTLSARDEANDGNVGVDRRDRGPPDGIEWAGGAFYAANDVHELLLELTQIGGSQYWVEHFRAQIRSDPQPDENGIINIKQQ
jgi:hypothetical protein